MKRELFLAGALLCAVASQAAESETVADPKAAAKRILAMRAAAQEIQSDLAELDQAGEADAHRLAPDLAEAMLQNLEAYRKKAPGTPAARDWIAQWRRGYFEQQMAEAIERAAAQSPLPLDRDAVLTWADPDWEKKSRTAALAYATRSLDSVYGAARTLAVELQRRQLAASRRFPSFEELDARLQPLDAGRAGKAEPLDPAVFQELKAWLKPFAGETGPVLEELEQELGEAAAGMAEEIARQYAAQTACIEPQWRDGQFPESMLTKAALDQYLQERLNQTVEPKPDSRPPGYGVFGLVRQLAVDAALWEQRRFEEYLHRQTFWIPQSPDLKQRLESDLPSHVDPQKSLQQCTRLYAEEFTPRLAESYSTLGVPADAAELRAYLTVQLKAGQPLGQLFHGAMKAELEKILPPVRRDIVERQFREGFKALAAGERVPAGVVESVYDLGHDRAGNFAEALAVLKTEHGWLAPDLQEGRMLQEARKQVVAALNEQVEPAVKSLRAQLQVLADMEQSEKETLKSEVEKGTPFADILNQWTTDWAARWQEQAEAMDPSWRAMFARTRTMLEKTVRQFYETVEAAESTAVPTPAAAADEGAPTEQPASEEMTQIEVPQQTPGEQGEESMDHASGAGAGAALAAGMRDELRAYRGVADGVLSFSDLPDGRCRLLFGAPDGQGALSVEFDPVDIDASARRIADALSGPLRDVLNGVDSANGQGGFLFFRRGSQPQLSMLFQVDSPAIRHQMSIRVRRRIQQEIQDWAAETGKPAPALVWQDQAAE